MHAAAKVRLGARERCEEALHILDMHGLAVVAGGAKRDEIVGQCVSRVLAEGSQAGFELKGFGRASEGGVQVIAGLRHNVPSGVAHQCVHPMPGFHETAALLFDPLLHCCRSV